jgi:molybdate transport system ATP-binding protein
MRLRLQNLRLVQGGFELKIDLEVAGETIGIFGRSGAGKTSLIEAIAGVRRPREGLIQIDGTVLMDGRLFVAPDRRGVGYVPQDLALFPHLSVRRNVLYGRPAARGTPPAIEFEQVIEVLEVAFGAVRGAAFGRTEAAGGVRAGAARGTAFAASG